MSYLVLPTFHNKCWYIYFSSSFFLESRANILHSCLKRSQVESFDIHYRFKLIKQLYNFLLSWARWGDMEPREWPVQWCSLLGPASRLQQLDSHVSGPFSGPRSSGSLYYSPVDYSVLKRKHYLRRPRSKYFCLSAVPRQWPTLGLQKL